MAEDENKTAGERCPTCDRTGCGFFGYRRLTTADLLAVDVDELTRAEAECNHYGVDWRERCLRAEDTVRLHEAYYDLHTEIDKALIGDQALELESLPERTQAALRVGATASTMLMGVVPTTQLLLEDMLHAEHAGEFTLPSGWLRRIYNQLTVLGMAKPR